MPARKPRKPPTKITTGSDPDAGFNSGAVGGDSVDIKDALDLGQSILDAIDDAPEHVQASTDWQDFSSSIQEGVKGIMTTIEERESVTPNQLKALNNWSEGVSKWVNK